MTENFKRLLQNEPIIAWFDPHPVGFSRKESIKPQAVNLNATHQLLPDPPFQQTDRIGLALRQPLVSLDELPSSKNQEFFAEIT